MTGKQCMRFIVIATALFGVSFVTQAQDVTVTSTMSSTTVAVGDQALLTVTVTGSDAGKAGEPELPPLPDFTVVRRGTSSNFVMNNMQTTITKSYAYALIPEKEGSYSVTATVSVSGKRISSAPVSIRVSSVGASTPSSGGASPSTTPSASSGGEDIFVRGTTDKKEAFVGEQVTYTFELFNRLATTAMEYAPPSTTGFWSIDLPKIAPEIRTVEGRQYQYTPVKIALFPTAAGTLTIGPATVSYARRVGIFSSSPTQSIKTKPTSIRVNALPEAGKPADFSGAVGKFAIAARAESTTVATGEVVTIHVTVTGEGNLGLIARPTAPDLSAFKTYDPRVTDTIANSGFIAGGAKSWEYMLIPRTAGTIEVAPFSLSFFDPSAKQYRTVVTEPVTLTVTPGNGASTAAAGSIPDNAVAADIRYIKPSRTTLATSTRLPHRMPLFYLLYLTPIAIFTTAFILKRRQDSIERTSGLKRKLNAWKHAQKRLQKADALLASGNATELCGILHQAITGYCGDILNCQTGSLTAHSLEELLITHGIPGDTAEHIRRTLELCEFVRFASFNPDRQTIETLTADTRTLITTLREALA